MDSFDVAYLICSVVEDEDLITMYNVNKVYRRAVLMCAKKNNVDWYSVGYVPDSLMASLPEIFRGENTNLMYHIIRTQRVEDRFVYKLFEYQKFMAVYYRFLSRTQTLSSDIIDYLFKNFDVDLPYLVKFQDLNDTQLRYAIENFEVDYDKREEMWDIISVNQKLTPEFIEDYYDSLNWEVISQYQTLTENTILNFSDYVHWKSIFQFQTLTEQFTKKYIHRNN